MHLAEATRNQMSGSGQMILLISIGSIFTLTGISFLRKFRSPGQSNVDHPRRISEFEQHSTPETRTQLALFGIAFSLFGVGALLGAIFIMLT